MRWFRLGFAFVRSYFATALEPLGTDRIVMRVGFFDADVKYANNAALLSVSEVGRIRLMVRTGFFKVALSKGWYLPLASTAIRFARPAKRFQRLFLETRLAWWDDEWIYVEQFMKRNDGKVVWRALVKGTVRHRRDNIPFGRILEELGHTLEPPERSAAVASFIDCDQRLTEDGG